MYFSNIIYTNNSISPLKGIQATVTPVIGIGTRYSIKPDIISFNLGTFITLPRSKINYLFSENDIYSNSEIKIQKISASINTGFDWNITKNFTMNIALTIPVAPAISDKVINYLSVGVSFKK